MAHVDDVFGLRIGDRLFKGGNDMFAGFIAVAVDFKALAVLVVEGDPSLHVLLRHVQQGFAAIVRMLAAAVRIVGGKVRSGSILAGALVERSPALWGAVILHLPASVQNPVGGKRRFAGPQLEVGDVRPLPQADRRGRPLDVLRV